MIYKKIISFFIKLTINHIFFIDIKKLKRKFSSPRGVVSNFFNQVEQTQDIKTGCHFEFTRSKKNQWTCKFSVQWPNPIEFSSTAITKAKAAETVSLNAIQWLQVSLFYYQMFFFLT